MRFSPSRTGARRALLAQDRSARRSEALAEKGGGTVDVLREQLPFLRQIALQAVADATQALVRGEQHELVAGVAVGERQDDLPDQRRLLHGRTGPYEHAHLRLERKRRRVGHGVERESIRFAEAEPFGGELEVAARGQGRRGQHRSRRPAEDESARV